MGSIKKYGINTLWMLSEKIIRLLFGFGVGVWIARYLGPENIGILSYSQSYVGLLIVFTNLGLDGIVVKELIRKKDEKNTILGTAFCLRMISSILMYSCLAITLNFIDFDAYLRHIILILALAYFFSPFNVLDCYYQSTVQGKYIAIIKITSLIVASAFKIAIIENNFSLVMLAWVIVLEYVLTAILFFGLYSKYNAVFKVQFRFKMAKSLLSKSWPLIFSGFFISIYMKTDQLMINYYMTSHDVGIYSIAVRLSELWYFIPMVLSASIFPLMIKEREQSEVKFRSKMKSIYCLVFWFALILSVFISVLGEYFIVKLYGSDYIDSSKPLMIHIWSSVFVFLGVFIANHIVILNRQIALMYGVLIGAISNILGNIYLIDKIGIEGAAYATLISQSIASIFYLLFFPDLRWIVKFVFLSLWPSNLYKKQKYKDN